MNLELRMYGLVPYNLSPIQQGIQFGHAVVRYGRKFPSNIYNDWVDNWETFIILGGNTTNNNSERLGTLNKHFQTLKDNNITCQSFYEPDLGDQLTAVCFIVDERVFNKEKYPDFDDWYLQNVSINDATRNGFSQSFRTLSDYAIFTEKVSLEKVEMTPAIHNLKIDSENFNKWIDFIGGKENLFLRHFLKPFKLA